jgi:hypothetical protein
LKTLLYVKSFSAQPKKKIKFCITCAKVATQIACFEVGDNVTVVEKYCDTCISNIK